MSEATPYIMQKPRGYPREIFKELDPKFLCAKCRLVLKHPIQNQCGHRFCKDCIDYIIRFENSKICPSCATEGVESESIEQTFPDNAIKREFNSMTSDCSFEGCSWSGPFKDYEAHYITCEYRELECQCGAKYTPNQQNHHLENECPFREVNCSYCRVSVLFKDLDEHSTQCTSRPNQCTICNKIIPISDNQEESMAKHIEKDVAGHMEIAIQRIIRLESILKLALSSGSGQESLLTRISTIENKLLTLNLGQQQQDLLLGSRSSVASASGGDTQTTASAAEPRIQSLIMEKLDVFERVITVLNREVEKLTLKMDSAQRERRQKTEQLDAMDRKVKSLERALAMKDATISELNIRLNALEQASYDGTLLWRIDDFARKRQEAISGRTTSIYSPSFYTSKTGYKMCARLYLNGDGMGKGTHVSLFFVIMRGSYDALLKWPFCRKVTLMFLEQSGKEHVTDAFRPDPTSSSFKRPTTEMNIASGCPLFMALSMLESGTNSFVKDNTAFIKIIVSENLS